MTTDNWGNKHIWVPFGKQGTVEGPNGEYEISKEDLFFTESLETLTAIPVYRHHPENPVVSPANYLQTKPIGFCTGKWRESKDGLGGEAEVKVLDQTITDDVFSGALSESSPTYFLKGKIRVYNHLALLPKGFARGGSKMKIFTEGYNDGLTTYVDPPSPIIFQYRQMEEILGTIAASQAALAGTLDQVVEKLSKFEAEPAEEKQEDLDMKQLAFSEGFAAGEILSTAKSFGFEKAVEGADVPALVTEARTYVVQKAFPGLAIEGFDNSNLIGAYKVAVAQLSKTANTATATTKPDVRTEGKVTTDAPLTTTTTTATKPSRLKVK